MTVLDTISRPSSDVHIDSVPLERPVFIQRREDNVLLLDTGMLHNLLDPLKFNVSLIPEDDGSITGVIDDLSLIENADTKESCIASLLAAMKDYAQDFYREFDLWSAAPNRRAHIPYVLKILSSSDSQLMEDVVCHDGKI